MLPRTVSSLAILLGVTVGVLPAPLSAQTPYEADRQPDHLPAESKALRKLVTGVERGKGLHKAAPRQIHLPTEREATTYEPPRWTWEHWWESNRDRLFERAVPVTSASSVPSMPSEADGDEARLRSEVIQALRHSVTEDAAEVRFEALLALGRIGDASTVPLIEQGVRDEHESVRRAALVALGLIGEAAAVEALINVAPSLGSAGERDALLIALGLATDPGDEALAALHDVADQPGEIPYRVIDQPPLSGIRRQYSSRIGWKPAEADVVRAVTLATWALRQHHATDTAAVLEKLLRARSPWQASELVLSLRDGDGSEQMLVTLRAILLAEASASDFGLWQEMRDQENKRLYHLGRLSTGETRKQRENLYRQYERAVEARAAFIPNDTASAYPHDRVRNERRGVLGLRDLYLARVRASAAMALAGHTHPGVRQTLIEALALREDAYSDLYKGQVLITLGRVGDGEHREALRALVGGVDSRTKEGRQRKQLEDLKSPLRGYAAIGLGLYLRSLGTGPDPKIIEGAVGLLGRRMTDRREQAGVRHACAVALGISGRDEALIVLQRSSEARGIDLLLGGYMLLGRALLDDATIVAPAEHLLQERVGRDEAHGLRARRAAITALGLLEGSDRIMPLLNALGGEELLAEEASVALATTEDARAARGLLEHLASADALHTRALAARFLGRLFARRVDASSRRTAPVLSGTNYMMRIDPLRFVQTAHNAYLMAYVIPRFEAPWW